MRSLLKRRAVGRDRILKPRRHTLALAEPELRIAEIVLRRSPIERSLLARHQRYDTLAKADGGRQGAIVAGPFFKKGVGLLLQLKDPPVCVDVALVVIAFQVLELNKSHPQRGGNDDGSRAPPGAARHAPFQAGASPKPEHSRSLQRRPPISDRLTRVLARIAPGSGVDRPGDRFSKHTDGKKSAMNVR